MRPTSSPGRPSRPGCPATAVERRRAARILAKNPSLKPLLAEIRADAYGDALIAAERQTGLPESAFPAVCPWTFAEAMQEEGPAGISGM